MGEVNFIPTSHHLLVTTNIEKVETHIIMPAGYTPKLKEIQRVVAKGPTVKDVEVGDWIVLNFDKYIKHVKTQSQIRAGVGGQEMIKEEVVLPFFAVPGDDTPYLRISSLEIDGTIADYDKLPQDTKEYTTMNEFVEGQEALIKEMEETEG